MSLIFIPHLISGIKQFFHDENKDKTKTKLYPFFNIPQTKDKKRKFRFKFYFYFSFFTNLFSKVKIKNLSILSTM